MINNFQDEKHPVHLEIMKSVGTINLTASFEEDIPSLEILQHIPGVVAFKCTLRLDGEIIGVGRGTSVINRMNRYIEKTVRASANASLANALYSARTLDTLKIQSIETSVDLASDKQKKYLKELIQSKNLSFSEEYQWNSKIESLTREEASRAIQELVKRK
jgi:hypothetical protein